MRAAAASCVARGAIVRLRNRNLSLKRALGAQLRAAAAVCAAATFGAVGCTRGPAEPVAYAEPAPSGDEQYCAWFGDPADGVLYFGEAPFWWALRSGGNDPRADLRLPGPQRIGRFDLRRRRLLAPLDLGSGGSAAGTWDVLAHPNGRVYFTDFFGASGSVDPATGAVARFDALGAGLNELALGPDGRIFATRYGSERNADGSLVVFDADGALVAEHALTAPPGYHVAPKSVAWDPVRREIWVNTDLLPVAGAAHDEVRHDARVFGEDGTERLRFDRPELQFMTFSADGTGWFAEADGSALRLRVRPPERAASALLTGRIVPLDDAFSEHDFVQDIHADGDGAVVTRWSGKLHVVDRAGLRQDVVLTSRAGDLYYSGVRSGGTVCATRCGTVDVVCRRVSDSLF
jgi:hypothetical protein